MVLLLTSWLVCISAERSSTGLLEFESKSDAVEALILTNHHPIPSELTFITLTSSVETASTVLNRDDCSYEQSC